MKKASTLNKNYFVILAVAVGYPALIAVLYLLKVPCLFQHFFGIPCFGCGMTRALLSALKLDFVSAFKLHPMFWSVPILYIFLLKNGNLFSEKADKIILLLIASGFLINWVIQIIIKF